VKKLKNITVIGLGLLGGSITQASLRAFSGVKVIGFTHRASTRRKARAMKVASKVVDDIGESVSGAELIVLATPISTFAEIFEQIRDSLPAGCIVTDVGSTKVQPHKWASKFLPKDVHYVGSHPIAGSERRGVEFSRDDLFDGASCVLTKTGKTDTKAIERLKDFWKALGCRVSVMSPSGHDKVFAMVSHLPHLAAACLVNAASEEALGFSGSGFIDSTRIASGPVNIWSDIFLTNAENSIKGLDGLIRELGKVKETIEKSDRRGLEKFLEKAKKKRDTIIRRKFEKKGFLS